ncbi:MAG: alpha/beta fold hydrolase [Bacteroidota bacterium]
MDKPSILLLHGALGSKSDLDPLKELLTPDYDVHQLNFSGHGGQIPDTNFSIDLFAKDVLEYIKLQKLSPVDIFGYSMGGYVALKVAMNQPSVVGKIFTLGTKFHWTPESAANEVKMLNPDKIKEKVPAFAEVLRVRHQPADWEGVMKKTADMMIALGNGEALNDHEFTSIQNQVLITVGTQDNMVSIEESRHIADQLPNSKFEAIEGWKHPIDRVDYNDLAKRVRTFLS